MQESGMGESLGMLRNKQTNRFSDEMKTSIKTRNTEYTREERKIFSKNQDKWEVIKYKKLLGESKTLKKNLWWEAR